MELTPVELGSNHARDMVRRLFRDYPGNLAVRLWDGNTLSFGTGAPDVCLSFRHPGPLRELVLFHDPMRLAEAYFRCAVDVEGNIYAALALKDHLQSLTLTTAEKLALLTRALLLDGTPSGDKSLPESGHRPCPSMHHRRIPKVPAAKPSPTTTTSLTHSIACGSTSRWCTPAPISRTPSTVSIRHSGTNWIISAENSGLGLATICSISAAAGVR